MIVRSAEQAIIAKILRSMLVKWVALHGEVSSFATEATTRELIEEYNSLCNFGILLYEHDYANDVTVISVSDAGMELLING